MIRTIRYEELPSYEIGLEKGIEKGIEKGLKRGLLNGKLESAATMIIEFGLPADEVAKKLKISIDDINRYLKSKSSDNENNY